MPSFKNQTKMSRFEAEKLAEEFTAELAKIGITHTQIAGSIRRTEDWIGDIDMILEGDLSLLAQIPGAKVMEGGKERVTLLWRNQQINAFRAEPSYWGAMLFYLTGPSSYTIAYRMKAKVKGWHLDQYGLFDKDGKKLAGETEEGIYKAFDKNYKIPSKRGKR